jgi:ParB family transcriptional regulator, chromosome partitioning protein
MRFEPKIVKIDSIDLENTSFKISTPKPIEDLVISINQFGLLSPPIVKHSHNGYIVVSGFHRVYACRKIGWMEIEARTVGPDFTDVDCLKLSIAHKAFHRQMNLIEQSIALSKLKNFYDAEEEFINTAKALGLGENRSYIKKLLKVQTFIPELQQSILCGAIPMTIAFEIEVFNKESIYLIIDLFEKLRPTLNQQKEILSMLKEISKITNCSIKDVLKNNNIIDTIKHPDIARAQKIKELRTFLQKTRFPFISSYYDRFNSLIQRLKLPNKVKLIPPENFEDVDYSLIFKFDSLPEFEYYVEVLKNLSRTIDFNAIFSNDIATQ